LFSALTQGLLPPALPDVIRTNTMNREAVTKEKAVCPRRAPGLILDQPFLYVYRTENFYAK
jgi:hypothetical protein